MGVFSVMIPDKKILKATIGVKRLLILGCLGCANDSLAYENGVPLAKIILDPKTGNTSLISLAMVAEMSRIKNVLEQKGIEVKIEASPDFCRISDDQKLIDCNWVESCDDFETIVGLCCSSGMVGIKRNLKKKIKVIPGMKTVGTIFSYVVCDYASGFAYLDKNKSAAIRIFEKKMDEYYY